MLSVLPHTTWNTPRSPAVAGFLWICFGIIGIHRAYLNRQHWLAMFLLGGFGWITAPVGLGLLVLIPVGILWLADLFWIGGWVADHNAINSHNAILARRR